MTARNRTPSSLRKRVLYWGSFLPGAVLLCCVLIILFAPKVINRDALRSRIEATISDNLGGTVTYDRIELILLPRPDIVFHNIEVKVPGTATASANTVKIYAQFLPLLRGRFAVSHVDIDRPVIELRQPGDAAGGAGRPTGTSKQPAPTIGKVLAVAGRAMPDLSLQISRGRLFLAAERGEIFSLTDLETELAFVPEPQEEEGSSGRTSAEHYRITGEARAVISGIAALPGPLRLSIKRFDVVPMRLTVDKARARLLDMDATLSGSIENLLSAAPRSDITINGSIGQDAAAWIRNLAGLPDDLIIQAPLKVTDARLRTAGAGSASSRTLTGIVAVKDDTSISFALRQEPDRFAIEKLSVKDHESDAVLKLTVAAKGRELSFTGTLTNNTLNRMFEHERITLGWIKGDMRISMPGNRMAGASAEGTLEGEQIIISSVLNGSLLIDRFSVRADGRTLLLQPAVLALGKDFLTIQGSASLSDNGLALDLDVATDRVDAVSLQELVKGKKPDGGSTKPHSPDRKLNVGGELRLRAAAIAVNRYTADDVSMVLSLGKDRATVDLAHASICGVGLDGKLLISGGTLELSIRPQVHGGTLGESIRCILHEDLRLTGTYDLSGSFTSRGSRETLLQSLQGDFDLSAKRGRIQSDRIVKGVIAYLNSTSLLKGSHSALLQEGVPYEAITFRGKLQDGVISLSEGVIRSRDIHITAEGDVDLRGGTLALNVLAAPFTSLDRLLGKIPIVKHIAGNALIVVPARVEGTFQKPTVRALPVSGVGTNISNLMRNIVQAPVKIVEPDLPRDREKAPP